MKAAYLLGVCVWLCQADATAQNAPVLDTSGKKGTPVIRRAPLDATIRLSDEGHQNIYLTLPGGWPLTVFDDFHNYLQKDRQNPLPAFILWNVSATGTLVGNYVETQIHIELSTTGYRPVRIPLGFKNGIFPSTDRTDQLPFQYTGTGSAYLTVDPNEEQYVAVVVPQSDQGAGSENSDQSEKPESTQHTLTFLLWFPFSQSDGGENRLPLSFPQSLSSQFQLEVPMSDIVPSVTQGSILTTQEHPEQQSTLLKVQGLRSDTVITWEKKKNEIVDDRPVLLVKDASIDVHLDARSTVYDAILPISSATGSFEQLKVRLPQGCILDREMTDKYAVAGDYSIENADETLVVTVRFQQKTSGPVSLRLRAVQKFEEDKPDFKRDLEGFEVLGAERQAGFLTVSVPPSEMKPHWDPKRGIRRSEGSSSNPVASNAPLASTAGDARFEFISQPFLLQVRVVAPQTRINVKPNYQFTFSRGTIEMTAKLTYTVSGAKTDELYVNLSDDKWKFYFGQSGLVDVVDVKLDASGLLTIPLRSPAEGTFDIELRARRSIPSEDEQIHRIVLPMPNPQVTRGEPQVTWSEPALVTLAMADHVEVLPIDASYSASSKQRTFGMTRQPRRTMPIRGDQSEFRQEPLVYRIESTDAVFVADVIYHQQKIKTIMQTDVRLLEKYNQVTQTISYDVDYAPVDRLYFLVPDSLESNGDIQISLENRTLELRDTITGPQGNIPGGWKRKIVQLPEPKFQFQLTIQYSLSPFTVPADVTELFSLFFVCPADVPVSDHRIHFFAPSDYKVELQDESKSLWESFREPRRPLVGATGTFRSVHSPNKIALSISVSEKNASGATVVERAWIQTLLTGDIRHDRVTYLLKTASDSVVIQLPPDAIQEPRIAVRVDKQPITPNIAPTGALILPILPEQRNRPIEVFIEYRYAFKMSGMEVPIFLPAFAKDTFMQFWQVILPPNKHIIACSGDWTLKYDWTWNGLFLGRIPSIRKSDIGFEPDDAVIQSNPNQYLFSHLHPSRNVTLYIASRAQIVLCSSSIALLIGLMLIYVRQSRYAGSLFGLGVVLIAVLFYQPPLVLLMLQAAVFGVFLALGAGYVYRIFHRQKQWIPSTFPAFDEMSQTYLSPLPSQTIHEVMVDEESAGKDAMPLVSNDHHDMSHNGQT